jgi:hypothetical protein
VRLSPKRRESEANLVCQSLNIAIYVVLSDIITANRGSKIFQMTVQEINTQNEPPHP